MLQKIFSKILSSMPQIVALLFIGAIAVFAWQEPVQEPPAGNVPSPLNIGPAGQSKEGGLILNTGGADTGLIVDKGDVFINGILEANLKQLVKEFVVAPNKTVAAGDMVVFRSNGYARKGFSPYQEYSLASELVFSQAPTFWVAILPITLGHFVLAYTADGNGVIRIGKILGDNIILGPEIQFNSGETRSISLASLTPHNLLPHSFAIAFSDSQDKGIVMTGSVATDGSITLGQKSVFETEKTNSVSLVGIAQHLFVLAYKTHYEVDEPFENRGYVKVGVITGNQIVFDDTEMVVAPNESFSEIFMTRYPYKYQGRGFALAYEKGASIVRYGGIVQGEDGKYYIFLNSENIFGSGAANIRLLASSGSDYLWIFYSDEDQSGKGTVIVGTVFGGSIEFGPKIVFNQGQTGNISVSSPGEFFVAYTDYGNSDYGTSISGNFENNVFTFGPEVVFNPGNTQYIAAGILGGKAVVAYQDDSNSDYGTLNFSNIISENLLGIAKETKAAGEKVKVIISGVSDVHSGLTPGIDYYAMEDGSFTAVETSYPLGIAISPTELLLKLK